MPSTQEIEIVLRNPQNKSDTLSYYIDVYDTDLGDRWVSALEKNLEQNYHLEKNYCFLGWAESPRDVHYLCKEINKSVAQINHFNSIGEWQKYGLDDYRIDDHFTPKIIIAEGEVGSGKPGLRLNHDPMNRLHRYFEDLQGEAWGLSKYYKYADHDTKWAIRQLNDLCHELESWVLSNRKKTFQPEWQRPSQITTFLNAPRHELSDGDYELFKENRYDREFGGVYLHWAQIGKTQFEVFRDEDGRDIDDAVCSSINSLKYFSGEFDVEWGRSVTEKSSPWHKQEQDEFRQWLKRNNFDYNDAKLSLGYIKLGQVNLQKSFVKKTFIEIISLLSKYLDIYQIKTPGASQKFDYVWSDPGYRQMQIDFLKPGYDWSKANA